MPLIASKFHPEFLVRASKIFPRSSLDKVLRALAGARPCSFRVNSLRGNPREIREVLERAGLKAEALAWEPSAFLLRKGRQRDLESLPLYEEGRIYLQNPSSLIPALALAPRPGESVLDLCAAPGGKICHIACLMENRGRLVAVEKDAVRFQKLSATLARQGASAVEAVQADGALYARAHAGAFDRVLLDAPCSAEGRFNASEPSSFLYWQPSTVTKNAKLQRRLIAAAVEALRPGGILVYSTCTLAPEENEGVVQHALSLHPGQFRLETIGLQVPGRMQGLTTWEAETFDPGMVQALRLLPSDQHEGFFVARLRKS